MAEDRAAIVMESFPGRDPRFPLVRAVRQAVFIEEQDCPPEEEWDDKDEVSRHLAAYLDGDVVGTLRWYDDEGWLHIGRVAVLGRARGMGIATALMRRCLEEGRRQGFTRAFLNAQYDKTGLYAAFGFIAVGEEFMEAGIRHIRMELFF